MARPLPQPGADWEDIYRQNRPEDLPWFTTRLDPDVEQALKTFRITPKGGPVLDLGTGPGTAAIEFARRGFQVTALDVSETAIKGARQRAGDLGTKIEWVVSDVFAKSWDARFQLIHDRGLYHSLGAPLRNRYADVVSSFLRPGGLLFLKTFSPEEPGDWGPNRIARKELEENLGGRLDLVRLEASEFPGRLDHSPKAWFATFQRPTRPAP
jgi:SAM-dependent methyltransferase